MRYSNERFKESAKNAGPVPKFESEWSCKMATWLKSKQSCFDGAIDWADWLAQITEDVCESWEDRGKADRPKAVLLAALDSVRDMLEEDETRPLFYQNLKRRIQDAVWNWKYGTKQLRAEVALRRTWETIGHDVLACGGEDPEQVVMDAAEVRDAVAACGLGPDSYVGMYGGDEAAVKWLDEQPREKQDELLARAFPAGRYGT